MLALRRRVVRLVKEVDAGKASVSTSTDSDHVLAGTCDYRCYMVFVPDVFVRVRLRHVLVEHAEFSEVLNHYESRGKL